MIEQMSNVFDQDRPVRRIKLSRPWIHGSLSYDLMNQACQGYWWYHFPWRFDSKFLHFSSRKPRWPHKMLVRNLVRAHRTQVSVRGTLISIAVFSCLSNIRFERKWIHNPWRTISPPSKHFDKVSFRWRYWRGTSRTCRNIHEINGKRTGLSWNIDCSPSS